MANDKVPMEVKVWGEFACFTRPEMKVERVSYPVMTPSAARGVLEAIFWKPEFKWRVKEIAVLKDIRYFSILRNEVNDKVSVKSVQGWAQKAGAYFADEDRAQRHTLALRDVAYVLRADIELTPEASQKYHPAKYRDQFRRRVNKGQCYFTPYLGCREFAASFSPSLSDDAPLEINMDLGRMLFDIDYTPDETGRGAPVFFAARLEKGVLRVPPKLCGKEA